MIIGGGRLEFQSFKWGYRHSCHFDQFVLRVGKFIEIDWFDFFASNQMSIIKWFGRCPEIMTACLFFNHFQAVGFSVLPILFNFWYWCNSGILIRNENKLVFVCIRLLMDLPREHERTPAFTLYVFVFVYSWFWYEQFVKASMKEAYFGSAIKRDWLISLLQRYGLYMSQKWI